MEAGRLSGRSGAGGVGRGMNIDDGDSPIGLVMGADVRQYLEGVGWSAFRSCGANLCRLRTRIVPVKSSQQVPC